MLEYEREITSYFLANCSADSAATWTKDASPTPTTGDHQPWTDRPDNKLLETLLLSRSEPLIDLALARYGTSRDVLVQLFARDVASLRCAVLSNPLMEPDKLDIASIVRTGNESELEALARNPYIGDSFFFEAMLLKKPPFAELSDEQYQFVLTCFGENPRISTPYHPTHMEGWNDYAYHTVFFAAWGLTRTAPPTEEWAHVLYELLRKALPNPGGFDDLGTILQRWRIDSEGARMSGSSAWLRALLANEMKADQSLLESDDLALRVSFYQRFSPQEFEDWPSFAKKDGADFLNAALWSNDRLWQTELERTRLESVAGWDDFSSCERVHQERHPEWFKVPADDFESVVAAQIRQTSDALDELRAISHSSISSLAATLEEVATWQRRIGWLLLAITLLVLRLLLR